MHKKLWGIALTGALCLNVVGVVPTQKTPVPSAPKTVAPKVVERTFKTAELTEMKYKKVSVLPAAVKSVCFTNQESLEDIKRVFGSTQSHTQVSKSIMPGVKKLLEWVDEAIAQFIKSTAVEHKETIKIEFKNEKDLVVDDQESFVVDLVFKKIGGKITVAVLISGKQPEEKAGHICNLLTAILTDDTLWQRYGVKISVGTGVVVLGFVLGKLWLNKRAAAKAAEEIAEFKARMADMTRKIAQSVLIFQCGVVALANPSFSTFDDANLVSCADGKGDDVSVITVLDVQGLENIKDRACSHLIIPAQIFEGGKKVSAEVKAQLKERSGRDLKVFVFDEKLVMKIDYTLEIDAYFQQYRNQARNELAEYGLEDVGCWFACARPYEDGEKCLVGVLQTDGSGWQVSPSFPCESFGYAISCLLEICGVAARHTWRDEEAGKSSLCDYHDATSSFKDCSMCKRIDAVAKIWGLPALEREDVYVDLPPTPPADSEGFSPTPFPSASTVSMPPLPTPLRRLEVPVERLTAASLAERLRVRLVTASDYKEVLIRYGATCGVIDGAWFNASTCLSTKSYFQENSNQKVAILFEVERGSAEEKCFTNYILITKPVSAAAGRAVYFSKKGDSSVCYFPNDAELITYVQGLLSTTFPEFLYPEA